jgi:hypothetical protein
LIQPLSTVFLWNLRHENRLGFVRPILCSSRNDIVDKPIFGVNGMQQDVSQRIKARSTALYDFFPGKCGNLFQVSIPKCLTILKEIYRIHVTHIYRILIA